MVVLGTGPSFETVYRAAAPSVYRRARAFLASEVDAQHVVHDVFAQLYEQPDRYRFRRGALPLVYALTTQACLNRVRRPALQAGAGPTSAALSVRPEAAFQHVLRRLQSPLDQLAIYYYLDELTQEELTELMSCSRRRVLSLLSHLHESETVRAEIDSLPPRSRPPGCASDWVFDTWFAGELSPEATPAVETHVATCRRCRTRRAEVATERATFLAMQPAFVASAHELARKHRRPVLVGLAIAAGALIALAALAAAPSAEVAPRRREPAVRLIVHRGSFAEHVAHGAALSPGDRVRFEYSSDRTLYLAVYGLDANGSVRTYLPLAPSAEPLAPGHGVPLDANVRLVGAGGTEQLFALFCETPFLVDDPARTLQLQGTLAPQPGCHVRVSTWDVSGL